MFVKKGVICYNKFVNFRRLKMSVKLEMSDDQIKLLKQKIAEHKQKPGPLMPTLHDAQTIFGCIPLEVQKIISEELGESIAKINGVVTFYSRFTLEPKGKHVIGVCLGTACYVRGSQAVIDEFKKLLKISLRLFASCFLKSWSLYITRNKMYWSLWSCTSIYSR